MAMSLEERIRRVGRARFYAKESNVEYRERNLRSLEYQKTQLMRMCGIEPPYRLADVESNQAYQEAWQRVMQYRYGLDERA